MLVSFDEFEALVNDAWDEIPESFKDELDNVSIVIEENPSKYNMKTIGKGSVLLGLFEGVPKISWGQGNARYPGKITLFSEPILSVSKDVKELKITIRIVLMHEIAHYFGYSERDMCVLDRRLKQKLEGENN